MHLTTSAFRRRLDRLPGRLQKVAEETFKLLKADPRHPSLHFKRIGKLWSVRIGLTHRALAVKDGGDFVWVWIGSHDEYERMIKDMR